MKNDVYGFQMWTVLTAYYHQNVIQNALISIGRSALQFVASVSDMYPAGTKSSLLIGTD